MEELLSKLTRFEALFELAGSINAATDIESVGEVAARRMKYVCDVFAWRYTCFDDRADDPGGVIPSPSSSTGTVAG